MPILWQKNRHLLGCPVLRKFCVLCQKCTTCFICTEWSPAEMNTLCDVTKLARNLFFPNQEKALCNMMVYIFFSLKIRFPSICKLGVHYEMGLTCPCYQIVDLHVFFSVFGCTIWDCYLSCQILIYHNRQVLFNLFLPEYVGPYWRCSKGLVVN